MAEVGLCLRSIDLPPAEAAKVAEAAEKYGFESFWMTEELSRASPPVLSLVAASTSKIKIGTAIINIFSRTPLNTAMTAATLQEISRDRFLLGLGVGGPDITRRAHGIDFSHLTDKMKEYVSIVRKFLANERFTFKGKFYTVDEVKIWMKRPFETPIYISALNPKMLRLAGEIADGVILNMFDPKASGFVDRYINEGRLKSMRQKFRKYSFVLTAVSRETSCMNAMKRAISFYLSSPAYRRILVEAGHGDVVEKFVETFSKEGREKALATVTDDLVDAVGAFSEENLVERLEHYWKADIVPLIYPQPRPGRELNDVEQIMKRFSEYRV